MHAHTHSIHTPNPRCARPKHLYLHAQNTSIYTLNTDEYHLHN